MKATVHEESPCRRALEVEIPGPDVRREIDRTTVQYARNLSLPGFRKGRVPTSLVRQRYQKEIESEVIERLTKDYSWQVIEEKELVPIQAPVVEKYRYKEGEPLTFRTTFEIRPEFSLGKYEGLEATRRRPPITDDLVEKNLQGLREQNARFDPVEGRAVQEGDFAVVDLQPLDESGASRGKAREGVTLDLGPEGTPQELRRQLLGLEVGGQRSVTVEARTVGEAAGKPAHEGGTPASDRYQVTLQAVRRRVLPDLDDEFARDVGPFESLDGLRGRLRQDLERRADDHADRQVRESLVQQLVDAHAFAVPEVLVDGELNQMMESLLSAVVQQGADPGHVGIDWEKKRTEMRPAAEARVRGDLILDAIARAAKLEVTDDEVLDVLHEQARRDRTTPALLRSRLEQAGRLNSLKIKMLRDNALDLVARSANIIG